MKERGKNYLFFACIVSVNLVQSEEYLCFSQENNSCIKKNNKVKQNLIMIASRNETDCFVDELYLITEKCLSNFVLDSKDL